MQFLGELCKKSCVFQISHIFSTTAEKCDLVTDSKISIVCIEEYEKVEKYRIFEIFIARFVENFCLLATSDLLFYKNSDFSDFFYSENMKKCFV
jgi:hypothetical protein